jgi:hypothetical protein
MLPVATLGTRGRITPVVLAMLFPAACSSVALEPFNISLCLQKRRIPGYAATRLAE